MTKPASYKLSDKLAGLIAHCERDCVADCCGICAFVFSPLYVASYLSAYNERITAADLAGWESEIATFERETAALAPTPEGYVCCIDSMNQYFTREDLAALAAELRHSLAASPEILALSNELSYPVPTHSVTSESWERIKKNLPPEAFQAS